MNLLMRKIFFMAIAAIALMACGNGDGPAPSGSKEQAALNYIGSKARTMLFMSDAAAIQKMEELGFTPLSKQTPLAPSKAPKMIAYDIWRFFMNAPQVDQWISVRSMNKEQVDAFNEVIKANKVYLEVDLKCWEGAVHEIELILRANSAMENVNDLIIGIGDAAWATYQEGTEEQRISWSGDGMVGKKSPRFSSWPNEKEFLKANSHVYASCSGEWLYPENPCPSFLDGESQYTYNYSIDWTDDNAGVDDYELQEPILVYGNFKACVGYYHPEEGDEEEY